MHTGTEVKVRERKRVWILLLRLLGNVILGAGLICWAQNSNHQLSEPPVQYEGEVLLGMLFWSFGLKVRGKTLLRFNCYHLALMTQNTKHGLLLDTCPANVAESDDKRGGLLHN